MLLSARDQENRTVAGSVQNGKNQFPKTPGGPMKTPFAGKGDENATGLMPLGGKAMFKGHADAFKTPMPQNRVPLGGKTTNLKATHNIQFNDPLQQTIKPGKAAGPPSSTKQTTRARRPARLSVTPAVALPQEEDEYPEIEYMPPPIKELDDIPDDYERIDLSLVTKNLRKDGTSNPKFQAKVRGAFEEATRPPTHEEEMKDLERQLCSLLGQTGKDGGLPTLEDLGVYQRKEGGTIRPLRGNAPRPAVKSFVERQQAARIQTTKPVSGGYNGPTKSSLAKKTSGTASRSTSRAGSRPASRAVSRPTSSLSQTSRPGSSDGEGTRRPRSKIWGSGQAVLTPIGTDPSTNQTIYHDDGTIRVPKKAQTILNRELDKELERVDRGEIRLEDIDYSSLETRVEKEYLAPEHRADRVDPEKFFAELFTKPVIDDDDEVYQIPL